ncbi:MAG: S8 family serine peptidase [Bacteroidota bacterium]|nr:S8 family serine peptidase [Bacteroidota bacterium]MDP4232534.1 S8 family serine peptidase [Bacteroidota bacterium]MDP4241669.1 S8 family serine peptidase [Bacteroidota bacterium]MDP4286414.1 S8 family serine peptidase [Bacteroidota bacterium]
MNRPFSLLATLSVFLLCALAGIANDASAQSQRLSLSTDVSPRSIIVKFPSAAAMQDTALLARLSGVSGSRDIIRPVFKNHSVAVGFSLRSSDPFGLSRIVQVPLREGVNAQDAVRALAVGNAFEYVEPNFRYHLEGTVVPNDSLFSGQWWLRNIHAPEAWTITEGDSTIKIGFVDTGIDWLHPDLKNQLAVNPLEDINHNGYFDPWPNDQLGIDARGDTVTGDLDGIDHDGNGYANDVIGYNFVDQEIPNVGHWSGRDAIPVDENGHGTAVAGVLAAEQNNHTGVSGVAPKCKLVALRAFTADGAGEDDDIASAIVYAADNGVRILNLSFGDVIPSLMQRDAIRYATSKGMLVFASSGNAGGDGPHYPSDFDDVVSVGGTSNYPSEDALYGFTTHGEGMDVVAPGENVLTTWPNGHYQSLAGTSMSSPIAAGVAALLLSEHPSYTSLELRSVLASTAQDVFTPGYDHYSANGRVDALRALTYPGGAAIKITSPNVRDEFHMGDTIRIAGSAMSTLFASYSIDYARGNNPDTNPSVNNWRNIATGSSQMLDSLLATWDTHDITQTGEYTLRLVVRSSDRRTTEEHVIVRLASTPPRFQAFEVDSVFANGDRGLLVRANSDLFTQLEVQYAAPGAGVSSKLDDKTGREHAVLIKREEAQVGVPLTITAILRAPNGDTSTMRSTATILDQAFSDQGFAQQPYSLPAGYVLDTVLSTPGGDNVVMLNYAEQQIKVFSFDGHAFHAVDSLADTSFPIALGNSMGDGKPELMTEYLGSCPALSCGTTRVYKQNAAHTLLGDLIFRSDTIRGSTFAKLAPDGKQQIVGMIDSSYRAYEYSNGIYQLLGTMVNTAPTTYYNPSGSYNPNGQPNSAHADLDGKGYENLITLDAAGSLVVYAYDASSPTRFKPVFIDANAASADGSLVATGDFDGDGRPDIAYAFHPIGSEFDTTGDEPAQFWTIRVLRNKGGMTFERIMEEQFFDRSTFSGGFGSSCVSSVPNITGGRARQLALTLFPNFYLMEFDSASQTMKPIWRFPLASSARGPIAWDFDRNGKRELGFLAGDSVRFFEPIGTLASRVPSPGGLLVSPRDTNRVDMEWAPVERATSYQVLRADPGDNGYTIIDTSLVPRYSDTTVSNNEVHIYSVAAVSSNFRVDTSLAAFGVEALVHPMPRLISASAANHSVSVRTSQPLRTARPAAGWIRIDDSISPESIAMSSDSEMVLGLAGPLIAGAHSLRARSFGLRDYYNSPFDTAHSVVFTVSSDTTPYRFYIVRWTFTQSSSGLRIHVVFNQTPGPNGLDVVHYTLTPYGTLVAVERDPADANALYIDVAPGVNLVALGVPFVLCVKGIESARNIPLDEQEGDCVGISFTEPNLDNVMVYPNPAKESDGLLTFARLTAQADIRIYTMDMHFIRHIVTSEKQGGAVWDMRDENGGRVESGMYLYFVTGKNDAGDNVEGKPAKFVIVGDQ